MGLFPGWVVPALVAGVSIAAAERPSVPPQPPGAGGILRGYTIASFGGSGQTSIQATAVDPFGNVYVAGTTGAPDFPVRNAAQPAFGDARILRSTDSGATWKPLGSPPQDVTAIVPDPAAPAVLFAGGASGIYKSADAGATWRLVYAFPTSFAPFNSAYLAIDPGNHLRLAATVPGSGALVRSLDGGETWQNTGNTAGQLFADPTGSGSIVSGSRISRDWGATFQPMPVPPPGGVDAVAFDPSHRGWIYVDTGVVMGSLYLSTDFGATWTAKASPNDTFSAMWALAVDPVNPNTLLGVTPDGLFVSTDGAASWTGPRRGILFDAFTPLVPAAPGCTAPGGVFAISGAGFSAAVAFSPDDGATWQTPKLSYVTSIASGPGCAVYATRQITTDAFVAKLAADGTVLWATYLGGSDLDQAVALAADSQGNVWVAGNTLSTDFPATAARLGPAGQQSVFVAQYSAGGALRFAQLLGGSAGAAATGLAVDAAGNAYVAARSNSTDFPASDGALAQAGGGFLVKLAFDGTSGYRTYIPGAPWAVAADAAGEAAVAGTDNTGVFVMKLNAAGSAAPASTHIAGANPWSSVPGLPAGPSNMALAEDGAGNVFLFSGTGTDFPATPGAYSAPQPLTACTNHYGAEGNAFVAKLAAADLTPRYTAVLRAPCGVAPGAIAVDGAGAAILGMASPAGLPLRAPLLAGGGAAVAKLSPDGSTLQFATYLGGSGTPGVAVGGDGSIYAGITAAAYYNDAPAAVLRLPAPQAPAVSLDGVANAFSGDETAVVEGGLYRITGTGFAPPALDLGLSAQSLPVSLGGIQVTFDDVPAPILRTDTGTVTAVMPGVPARRNGKLPGFTLLQIAWNGVASQPVWVPVAASLPGLRTRSYPALTAPPLTGVDAYALNADGTLNDATHPAAVGTSVTLLVTGMGSGQPEFYTSWQQLTLPLPGSGQVAPLPVTPSPGMIAAVGEIQVPVTAQIQALGQPDANGVVRFPLALQTGISYDSVPPPASNRVEVYIR